MNPYEKLEDRAFWRKAVADVSPFDLRGLWRPRLRLSPEDPVATFGSCFAQHIGRALAERGFHWLITEPGPHRCPPELALEFNYGVFSARTGNIYTSTLLNQWARWAAGDQPVPDEIWECEGTFFDPFRPNVEPGGFESAAELQASRAEAIEAFRRSIVKAKVFVFTMGLTESWWNAKGGYEYPMCPGTVAGVFQADQHVFVNQRFDRIHTALTSAISTMRRLNPQLKVLLTVSPVPLTATASGEHVLVATMHSKAILRAVAGQITASHDFVDYFPSFEIITAPVMGGMFFEPNKRSVHPRGVAFVMDTFFNALQGPGPHAGLRAPANRARPAATTRRSPAGEVCEEALLAAFGDR